MPLSFIVFFKAYPVFTLPHISYFYPRVHFIPLFLPSKPHIPVSQRAITFSDVMEMAWMIQAIFALPLKSCVAKSKDYMTQTLSFPMYRYINHFKSETLYLLFFCIIFATTTTQRLMGSFSYMKKIFVKVELCWLLVLICSKNKWKSNNNIIETIGIQITSFHKIWVQLICNKLAMLNCMKNMNDCLFIFWWFKKARSKE